MGAQRRQRAPWKENKNNRKGWDSLLASFADLLGKERVIGWGGWRNKGRSTDREKWRSRQERLTEMNEKDMG